VAREVAYLPTATPIRLYNLAGSTWQAQWFNPVTNQISAAKLGQQKGVLEAVPPAGSGDLLLILQKKK
jgi:hypothetical protein